MCRETICFALLHGVVLLNDKNCDSEKRSIFYLQLSSLFTDYG